MKVDESNIPRGPAPTSGSIALRTAYKPTLSSLSGASPPPLSLGPICVKLSALDMIVAGWPSIEMEAVMEVWGDEGCDLGVVTICMSFSANLRGVRGTGCRKDRNSPSLSRIEYTTQRMQTEGITFRLLPVAVASSGPHPISQPEVVQTHLRAS